MRTAVNPLAPRVAARFRVTADRWRGASAVRDGRAWVACETEEVAMNIRGTTAMKIRSRFAGAALASCAVLVLLPAAPQVKAQATGEAHPAAGRVVIADFNVGAPDGVRPGDTLKLSLTGTPGGEASAEVAGIPERIALAEVRRGLYEGAYTVRRQDRPWSPVVATGFLRVGGVESMQRYPADGSASTASAAPAGANPPPAAPAACPTCGVVEAVKLVDAKSDDKNIVGTIAGGVLGGVLGHQVGGGTGKTVATVAGTLGGAYAGNRVQNSMDKGTQHEVVVRLGDGSTRTFLYAADPGLKAGDRVRVEKDTLVRQ